MASPSISFASGAPCLKNAKSWRRRARTWYAANASLKNCLTNWGGAKVSNKEEKVARIRTLAAAGYSMTYVADDLSAQYNQDISRSAIAGLARRNGIKFDCGEHGKANGVSARPRPIMKGRKPRSKEDKERVKTEKHAARAVVSQMRRPVIGYVSTITALGYLKKNKTMNVQQRCVWHGCTCAPAPGQMTCDEHRRTMRSQGGSLFA